MWLPHHVVEVVLSEPSDLLHVVMAVVQLIVVVCELVEVDKVGLLVVVAVAVVVVVLFVALDFGFCVFGCSRSTGRSFVCFAGCMLVKTLLVLLVVVAAVLVVAVTVVLVRVLMMLVPVVV